jgi:hypothetical protein
MKSLREALLRENSGPGRNVGVFSKPRARTAAGRAAARLSNGGIRCTLG